MAERQPRQSDLHRHADQHAAQCQHRAGRRSAALPLDDSATADPNDEVIGVDFSGGLASVVTQLNTRFGRELQFSNPSGTTLQVLDDGAANTTDVNALVGDDDGDRAGKRPAPHCRSSPMRGVRSPARSAPSARRASALPAASPSIRRCSAIPRSSRFTARARERRSNAAEFHLPPIHHRSFAFSPQTGLGNASSPFTGSVPALSAPGAQHAGRSRSNASSLAQGQDVVVNALQQRFTDDSGVNVDQEMANLIQLQTAYGANARVMSAVRDMIDTLMKM